MEHNDINCPWSVPTITNIIQDLFDIQYEQQNLPKPFHNQQRPQHQKSECDLINRVRDAFKSIVRAFHQDNYSTRVLDAIRELDSIGLNRQNAEATFISLSNDFFSEGILWRHVVTYFIFSSQFAHFASQRDAVRVEEVSRWVVNFTIEHLITWIRDNGGWDGVIKFAEQLKDQQPSTTPNNNNSIDNQNDSNPNSNNQENNQPRQHLDLNNVLRNSAGALGVLSIGLYLATRSN